jgi:hypothetical protein
MSNIHHQIVSILEKTTASWDKSICARPDENQLYLSEPSPIGKLHWVVTKSGAILDAKSGSHFDLLQMSVKRVSYVIVAQYLRQEKFLGYLAVFGDYRRDTFIGVLENINWLFFDVMVLKIHFWWSENSAMFFGLAGKLRQVNTHCPYYCYLRTRFFFFCYICFSIHKSYFNIK